MSDEEIEKAVKEAAEFEAQDKKRKEAIDTRNEADSFVFQTEKALNEVGDKVEASQKETVEADLKALKDLLESTKDQELNDSQINDIKAAKEKLMNDAQALFAKVYEQAQGAAGAQGAGPDMSGFAGAGPDMGAAGAQGQASGNNDDNVVDGDFREV
jgi:molecular chaperone DnaK